MKVRCVKLAFVSAAFLAAIATTGSSALANSSQSQLKLTRDAYKALQAGDTQASIAGYSQAIESNSLEPEVLANALLNRGLAYQQGQSDAEAIADYSRALKLDAMAPQLRATALYNRGLSYQRTGNTAGAIEDFTSALLLNPEFAHAYFSRGNALRDSGQLLFALSDYERALKFKHPDPSKVHYNEAMAYMALRRPLDAKRALGEVLSQNPEHAGALEQLAKLNAAGDNASVSEGEADPILTGSVSALAGGTNAVKPILPKAVDLPEGHANTLKSADAKAAATKPRKLITERLPTLEAASYQPESETQVAEVSQGIDVSSVPAIPEAEEKAVTEPAVAETAPATQVASAEPVPEETSQPAADEAAAAEPPAEVSGWMVQVASAASEDAAWSTWKKMQKNHKVLRELNPVVVKADLGSKGIFYRVRLQGFDDQSAAKNACGKLKAGGVSCFIAKS